ncbi:MAG: hypothetical protein ACYTE8_00510, partial [Planctomycetota bacterium]
TATTSGTDVTLASGLSAGITEILIMLNGVSGDTANQPPIVQLGDAGGFETTGYYYGDMNIASGGMYQDIRTDGFATISRRSGAYAAAELVTGHMSIYRWDASEHLWFANGWFQDAHGEHGCGYKTLSGELTQIKLTTPGGSATFDAGEARVRYR